MEDEILASFVESLPARPYATDDFRTGVRIMKRFKALELAHIQLNGVLRAYLPFDIDIEGAAFAWEKADMPAPTIITINPENSHAHYLYGLDDPVAFLDRNGHGKARRGPMNYYKLIQTGYRERLQADAAYPGFMTKNPLSRRWERIINGRTYGLDELAEYVDLRGIKFFNRISVVLDPEQGPPIPEGYRNNALFDSGRMVAYAHAHLCSSQEDLCNVVMNHCALLNTRCHPPLDNRQIFLIAKSISRWSWPRRDHFSRDHKKRGACQFEPIPAVMEAKARQLEIQSRQRAGAVYTASFRRAEAERKIQAAIAELKEGGEKVTKASVSKITGISARTLMSTEGEN